jgi:hypothetical protein
VARSASGTLSRSACLTASWYRSYLATSPHTTSSQHGGTKHGRNSTPRACEASERGTSGLVRDMVQRGTMVGV